METSGGGRGSLRIGELARRTGVSAELLRAWERRYGVLSPHRTSGGFRLYTETDERRVRTMRELIAGGLSAGEAARVALGADEPVREPQVRDEPTPELRRVAASLETALDRFDEAAAHAAIDRLLSEFTVSTVLARVVIPYLHRLGERWSRGTASVAQEHFASGLLRGRLLGLARGWGSGSGPHAILACPPGELHDLALIMLGIELSRRGWRITFLGPDTPMESLADTTLDLRPDALVVSSTEPRTFTDRAPAFVELAGSVPTAIAGPGASDEVAASLGVSRLEGDPVSAARAMADGWRPSTTSARA